VLLENEILCLDEDVKRVVLCTGKVYYDLFEERQKRGLKNVFFMRLEQLYPFPYRALATELARFPKAQVVWCQEEPMNMGAWTFVAPRLQEVLTQVKTGSAVPAYVGRAEAASPATGMHKRHVEEQRKLVDEALTL